MNSYDTFFNPLPEPDGLLAETVGGIVGRGDGGDDGGEHFPIDGRGIGGMMGTNASRLMAGVTLAEWRKLCSSMAALSAIIKSGIPPEW